MRILNFYVKNFGSFKELNFSFNEHNTGLIRLSGDTGAGKSTFNDIIPWILYGITAKNGKVDDVRTWNVKEPTMGFLALKLNSGDYVYVHRTRGSLNDLFWQENLDLKEIRGTNLTETQELLEHKLGISKDFYLFCSMFNEFSVTRNFFMGDVDTRRKLFNEIAYLGFSTNLKEIIKNEKKETKSFIDKARTRVFKLDASETQLVNRIVDATARSSNFEQDTNQQLLEINQKSKKFDEQKEKNIEKFKTLETEFDKVIMEKVFSFQESIKKCKDALEKVNTKCPHCGEPNKTYTSIVIQLNNYEHELLNMDKTNTWTSKIENEQLKLNPFKLAKEQLLNAKNPFLDQIKHYNKDLTILKTEKKVSEKELKELEKKLNNCLMTESLLIDFNKMMLVRSVDYIQHLTNENLTNYFDSEIQVKFNLVGSSDIDVSITKNGNYCSYSQLSRGQRSMLNLCFSVAVMKTASQHKGVTFNVLFFDEVLDGLSSEFKIKAVSLFQRLNIDYESIFLIDHATELEGFFDKTINFTLVNNESIIKNV